MTASRICCVCDQPITGRAKAIIRHSASGARPNDWAHPAGDPACARRQGRSVLGRYMPRHP